MENKIRKAPGAKFNTYITTTIGHRCDVQTGDYVAAKVGICYTYDAHGEEMVFGNTCVDILCQKCAVVMKHCKHCDQKLD